MRILAGFMSFVAGVFLVGTAVAGSVVLTFDVNNLGTSTWGTYNTTKQFEGEGGNPGACVKFHGIGGLGGSFANNGFTGDFAAAGFTRISMDIKTVQWVLRPDNSNPKGYIFARYDDAHWPWCKEIADFDPVSGGYRTYSVDFNPGWTDAEAQANGWAVVTGYGDGATTSFGNTFHHVHQTGFWVQGVSDGAQCSVLVDNWKLGPSGQGVKTIQKPVKMDPKRRVQPFPVLPRSQIK
ncbi:MULTISPECIES: hypothetical protein [unclassified Pseudodesulfovibrio]|uniref:hypothetical protein n=1 Tax=unclassified Pseudodesulfovibrio TaxID=2661612 RepID=UPI000FEC0FA5|nr:MULTISPECIES: hypothetical protein [unclassified Pseudodesulfovibrio]MCJ2166311.1 hypothetical protein [Pseudodesulfovibrio sp. S3-i]RWU02245.1 hypothetical protein DWB63_17130 [Pseudodesulfovibrio sp. S3]